MQNLGDCGMQNLFSSMNRMNADIGRQNRGRDQHKLIGNGAKTRPNRIYHQPLTGLELHRVQPNLHHEHNRFGAKARPTQISTVGWSQNASKPSPRHICWPITPLPGHEAHAHSAVMALLADSLPGYETHAQGAVMALLADRHRRTNSGAKRWP
jgi:hypothetical protein